jgi:hypothetical protein
MVIDESTASGEAEFRAAMLAEFLKPDLPTQIALLRHAERYLVKLFDAYAERHLAQGSGPGLEELVSLLPKMFFGNFGSLWSRTIEYAMIGLIDHSPGPHPNEKEILARYCDIDGHLFVKYALTARRDAWRQKDPLRPRNEKLKPSFVDGAAGPVASLAASAADKMREAFDRGWNSAVSNEASGPSAPATILNPIRSRPGPKPNAERTEIICDVVEQIAPDGQWKAKLVPIAAELDRRQVSLPTTWGTSKNDIESWSNAAEDEDEKEKFRKVIAYCLKKASANFRAILAGRRGP